MDHINIRKMDPGDWLTYKELRLRSLQDSPEAFGATFEQESCLSDKEWMSRLRPSEAVVNVLPLLAEQNEKSIGLISAVIHSSRRTTAHIYQMWVAPEARDFGNCQLLQAKVCTGNTQLERSGFRPSRVLSGALWLRNAWHDDVVYERKIR